MTTQVINIRKLFLVKKDALFSIAAPLYMIFSFFRFYVENSTLYNAITILSISSGILLLLYSGLRRPVNPIIISTVFLFSILGLLTSAIDINDTIQSLPQFISNLGYAWALAHARLSIRVIEGALLALIAFFFAHIFSDTNPENVFTISRNYISAITILFIAFYIFACNQSERMPSITILILSMVILLWAIGRAGILSGVIILLGIFIMSKKHLFTAIFLVALTSGATLHFRPDVAENLSQITVGLERFEQLSTQSQRQIINDEYIESVSVHPSDLLFGAPLNTINAIQQVDGNPHNAFISLHVMFGISGVIIFGTIFLLSIWNLTKNREHLLTLMLLVGAFRSLFDSTAFHGPMDVVMFYCLFKGLKYYNLRTKIAGHDKC